jgi:cellulose synthase/poly-beta-1,6-N-acetylglucosamine synthase-like glycosyltransferase
MNSECCETFSENRLLYICDLKPLTLHPIVILFCAAIFIQISYFLIFAIVFNRKTVIRKSNAASAAENPVSILVCAHDEEHNIRELLPLLLNQRYAEFEVVVINDRSNDNTYDFLLEEGRRDSRVRMVNVDRIPPHVNSKKYSLTLGIRAAKYDLLLLTDADCRPDSEDWISSMSSAFEDRTQFVLGFSPYRKSKGFLNLFIRFETLLTALQYCGFALMRQPYMGVGRNLAYRKSFFLAGKGFHEFMNVTGGDDDLYVNRHATSNNTTLVLSKAATISTFGEDTWSAFFRQKQRHLSVGKLYKMKHRFWLGLFTISWLICWITVIPAALLSPFPLVIAGAMLLRISTLVIAFNTALQRLEHKFELWTVPFLDFLFSIYYLTTGLLTLGSKNVRWKN